MKLNPDDYRFIPGVTEVVDLDIDALNLHDALGNPITEESLERDAEEAERQQRAGLIPGGKSLSGDGSHSPVFQVTLGADTARKLRAKAAQDGTSVSKCLRSMVERDLAEAA